MIPEELRIGDDNICPVTNKPCDDECCPPGAICNISGPDQLSPAPEENRIVITEWEYKGGIDAMHPEMVYKDKKLSDAINDYYERVLEPQDIEIFQKKWNIIATSKKMYGAFFEKDLKHADPESK